MTLIDLEGSVQPLSNTAGLDIIVKNLWPPSSSIIQVLSEITTIRSSDAVVPNKGLSAGSLQKFEKLLGFYGIIAQLNEHYSPVFFFTTRYYVD